MLLPTLIFFRPFGPFSDADTGLPVRLYLIFSVDCSVLIGVGADDSPGRAPTAASTPPSTHATVFELRAVERTQSVVPPLITKPTSRRRQPRARCQWSWTQPIFAPVSFGGMMAL